MAKAAVEGFKRVIDSLDARQRAARKFDGLKLLVGYSAPYAVHVHEDLQASHPGGGQAKFLEQPMRTHGPQVKRTVARALKAGTPPASAMALGGNYLLAVSRPLVPVDTGELRDSGYVRVEGSAGGMPIPGAA